MHKWTATARYMRVYSYVIILYIEMHEVMIKVYYAGKQQHVSAGMHASCDCMYTFLCITHAGGVSLVVRGVHAPNDSLVDVDDILYTTHKSQTPTDYTHNLHDASLVCVTNLEDCCKMEQLGHWYFPDGTTVPFYSHGRGFRSTRGQNEYIFYRQLYGSVRLYRFFSSPIRGHFRCVLPNADNVDQTLYANIGMLR